MERGAHRGHIRQQAVIKAMDVPVGIGQQPACLVEPFPDVRRNIGAGMGKPRMTGDVPCLISKTLISSLQNRQDAA